MSQNKHTEGTDMPTEGPDTSTGSLRGVRGSQAGDELDNIIKDLVNFLKWESEQDWKPDYDREANRQNSINRTIQTLEAYAERLATERAIEELNDIEYEYGHRVATTWINGKPQTIRERIAELCATLTGKADHE